MLATGTLKHALMFTATRIAREDLYPTWTKEQPEPFKASGHLLSSHPGTMNAIITEALEYLFYATERPLVGFK